MPFGTAACLGLLALAACRSNGRRGIEDGADPVPRYDLTVQLATDLSRLDATAVVTLPPADEPRETIEFLLGEHFHDVRVSVVEPAAAAGDAIVESKSTDNHANRWTVRPAKPVAAGVSPTLKIAYSGGEKTSFVFHLGDDGSFAGGPNTAWFPQWDDEARSRGTGRLRFAVPSGITVLATGARRSAADAEKEGRFEFDVAAPARFSFAAARYVVRRVPGRVPMTLYLMRERPNADDYAKGCARILERLEEEFGPFPYGDFGIAEVPRESAAQAGFSGASFEGFMMADSSALDESFNMAFYGHEIGHQWWGNLVLLRGERGGYLLDEAMAQLGALWVVDALEGPAAALRFRRDGYPGSEPDQCARGYFWFAGAGLDQRLDSMPRSLRSHELADSKGFLVMDLLARTAGRDAFRRALRAITSGYASRGIEWEQFRTEVERAAGRDLGWFFAQWFERTGAPEFSLAWEPKGDDIRVVVTQAEPFYRASLELRADGDGGARASRVVDVDGARTEISWRVPFRPRAVTLDPDDLVLRWTRERRAESAALAGYWLAVDALREGRTDEGEKQLNAALASVPKPDLYAARFLIEVELAKVAQGRQRLADARTHAERAIACPTRRADLLPWLYYGRMLAARFANDDAAMRAAFDDVVSAAAATGASHPAVAKARAMLDSAIDLLKRR